MKYKRLRSKQPLKPRHFSLLEVLIAMAIIALALPLLMSPFIYTTVDSQEALEKADVEAAANLSIASFLADLHLNKIPVSIVESNQEMSAPQEWYQGRFPQGRVQATYRFRLLKNHEGKEGEKIIQLWQIVFSLKLHSQKKSSEFEYDFIVIKEMV